MRLILYTLFQAGGEHGVSSSDTVQYAALRAAHGSCRPQSN